MGLIGALAAAAFLYHHVDEQIRATCQDRFAQHYSSLKVSIRSAEFVAGEGIRLHGILIADPAADGPRADLLTIDELFLVSKTELKDLLVREPVVSQIIVRRPTLHVTRRHDGSWSASKLSPPPKFGKSSPDVIVENGTIEIFDPTKRPTGTLPLRDLNLKIQSAIAIAADGSRQEVRQLQGMFACDYLRRVEFQGVVNPKSGAFTFSGTTQGLDISPELRDALPEPLCSKIHAWGELRAEGKFDFQIAYDPTRPDPPSFRIDGTIVRGQINDPRLPHPLSDVKADFHATNSGFRIDQLTAKSNQATLKIHHYQCQGYEPNSPKTLKAEIRHLDLDLPLYSVLPPKLQEKWKIYRPLGKIDADVNLEFDGQTWQPNLTLKSTNLSFSQRLKRPDPSENGAGYRIENDTDYRFENGAGTLSLIKNIMTLNMTANGGGRPIRIQAEIMNPLTGPTYLLEAQGNAFPLDENLFRALSKESQKIIRALEPQGTVNFYFRSNCDVPGEPPHHHLFVNLNRCSIRYEKFPYPISNITGKLVMFDNQWDFFDLKGSNNSARISGDGEFKFTREGNLLRLDLKGQDVRLEQDLHTALPPTLQSIWRGLKPVGTVDLVTNITYLAEKKLLSVGVTAEPQKDTTSIEPDYFPYRMEKLQGKLIYRDGNVTLEKLRGWHGNVELRTEGLCNFNPAGPWEMHFKGLSIDGLDRDLIQALPERLRKGLLALNLSRPANMSKSLANLHGDLDFYHSGLPGMPLESRWDMTVNLFQNEIQTGIKLENLCGNVRFTGVCDGRHIGCRGELTLDSATFKDYQFTNVSGPLWIDDDRVLFGKWVDDPHQKTPPPAANPPRQPRPISANLFEGIVNGKGWIKLGADSHYGLEATLEQANLTKVVPGRENLKGKVNAGIGLIGNGATRNSMQGAGNINVSDAYVYELPSMMQLLKILRLRKPDPNAFSTIDLGYRIEGEHIYFDSINFNGDAINLHGTGEMDWQANLNVNLAAGITKNDSRIPILGEMISGTSRGAMLIRVRGPLQDPNIDQVALPAVNQALQQLQERRKE